VTAATPALSVVVVSLNGPHLLRQALTALAPQMDEGVQVLVVHSWTEHATGLVAEFPFAEWVVAAPRTTVPMMRRLGMHASRGRLVALIEDDCVVSADWCRTAVRVHEGTAAVAIGGAVEPGPYRRSRDWAVYFCEFGRFMPPLPTRETTDLAGNNVVYRRDALEALPKKPEGFYDAFVHPAWAREGRLLRSDGSLVVRQVNSWPRQALTSMPFHHGRAFAGMRLANARRSLRLAAGLLAPFLPLLAVTRIIGIVVGRGRHRASFVQALPWIVLFSACWSLGECAGYLSGPGDSAMRWC